MYIQATTYSLRIYTCIYTCICKKLIYNGDDRLKHTASVKNKFIC